MELFEQASRKALRFATTKGLLSTEDLWTLPLRNERGLPNLNDIAKSLNKQVQDMNEGDFVEVPGKKAVANDYELSLDVVKHIIAVRQAEEKAASEAKERKEQKQTLLGLLEQKKTEALGSLSVEELQAKISAL